MMTTPAIQSALTLAPIPREGPWEAYLLKARFPMGAASLAPTRAFLDRLSAALAGEWQLSPELFLQFTELHQEDGTQRISKNGRRWMLATGLGVWPDRPGPTPWTAQQFENLMPGDSLPALMHIVFRVTTGAEACHHARTEMLGLGSVVQVLTDQQPNAFQELCREVLLPPIQHPSYTCFPFYVPLYGASTLRQASAAQLDEWSCGATVYLRESPEDGGIVIASRRPLRSVLRSLGWCCPEPPESVWELPPVNGSSREWNPGGSRDRPDTRQ